MSIEEEFAALRESADEQARTARGRFVERNSDPERAMRREGALLEYAREFDRLYITVGKPREGMALFAGEVVVMADPETLEWIGMDIPDFKKSLSAGGLNDTWERLAQVLDWQPVLHIPPTERSQQGAESAPQQDLLHDLAQEFSREVAAV